MAFINHILRTTLDLRGGGTGGVAMLVCIYRVTG